MAVVQEPEMNCQGTMRRVLIGQLTADLEMETIAPNAALAVKNAEGNIGQFLVNPAGQKRMALIQVGCFATGWER